eukprot:8368150-Pyramimonas_sp.AAC.1
MASYPELHDDGLHFPTPQWEKVTPNMSSMDDFKGTLYPIAGDGITDGAAGDRKQTSAQIH